MEMNNQLKDFLNAIGAVAETSGLLRDYLIQNGFTRQEAVYICSNMIASLFAPRSSKTE